MTAIRGLPRKCRTRRSSIRRAHRALPRGSASNAVASPFGDRGECVSAGGPDAFLPLWISVDGFFEMLAQQGARVWDYGHTVAPARRVCGAKGGMRVRNRAKSFFAGKFARKGKANGQEQRAVQAGQTVAA